MALPANPDEDFPFEELTPEEARDIFEHQVQECLGISGEEFIRRWDAGEFDGPSERPGVMHVAMLLPLVR